MLSGFRKFAKSWLAVVLLGLIILSFVIIGLPDALRGSGAGTNVIKAGGRTVDQATFQRAYTRQIDDLQKRNGQPIPLETAIQQGVDQQMLQQMSIQESLAALLEKLGLRASDKMLAKALGQQPEFFDPITGKFDQKAYLGALQRNGMTAPVFERGIRDDMIRSQYAAAAASGLRAPHAYTALTGVFAFEQRDLAYFVIPASAIGEIAPPTDAEVQAFVKENAAQLTLPEFRVLSIARISRASYEAGVVVNPADVERQFNFQKDSLSTPELRTVTQIPVKDAAQAQAVIARLNKGESPNVVAGAIGVQPVHFEEKPRTAFFDPAVAAAAFQLADGGVSAPIKTQFGLAVLKVLKVTPGRTADLAAHRAQLEAKVRTDMAGQKVSDVVRVYEDAHAAGADLKTAAAKAGLPIINAPPVTADGRAPNGQPLGLPEPLLKAAFQLSQGGESDIIEVAEGEYVVLRVDRIIPPALRPMEEIKPLIIRELMTRKARERLTAKADALIARIGKGESLDAAAASVGAKVQRVNGMTRIAAEEHKALGGDLLRQAFDAKRGAAFQAPAPGGIAVGQITAIRAGDTRQSAEFAARQTPQASQQLFGALVNVTGDYARSTMKTSVSPRNARIAIGVAPEDADRGLTPVAGKGAPAGKGK